MNNKAAIISAVTDFDGFVIPFFTPSRAVSVEHTYRLTMGSSPLRMGMRSFRIRSLASSSNPVGAGFFALQPIVAAFLTEKVEAGHFEKLRFPRRYYSSLGCALGASQNDQLTVEVTPVLALSQRYEYVDIS
jgi:hypothetical protein